MKKFIVLIFLFTLVACYSDNSNVRNDENQIIYQTDSIELMGKSPGLPESIQRVYLTLFTDYSSTPLLQQEFDKQLRFHLQSIAAIRMENQISSAQAVIEGKIKSYTQTEASRITNISGLLYQLRLSYSVRDHHGKLLQDDKEINEEILVSDTNRYLQSDVIPILADHAARHTAQAILYGWQKEYRETGNQIFILGEVKSNDLSTNR